MSKKKNSLGRSLIKQHNKNSHFVIHDGYRHNSDLPDGRDWGRLNLHSVTEQTSLNDFLDKTELAAAEYESEFSNIKIVERDVANGILTAEEQLSVNSAQERNQSFLSIPRRPFWDQATQKEELDAKEKQMFLEWRRTLSKLQEEEEHISLTPYEKNLEIWRQLWRVIERSDVLVQILDARNPLLFRCPDLETYVKEVDSSKTNVLLINKADFLTESERECWCKFFENVGVKTIFFSALEQMERKPDDTVEVTSNEDRESQSNDCCQNEIKNSSTILSREELVEFLKEIGSKSGNQPRNGGSVIGLVGYPNVGKSSTVNALLMCKKVSVSATPGKTKHFQTHVIDKDLILCDCPGLVFPNFVSTKAEMVINGILPIDQLTNWVQPMSLVTNLIPRKVLERTYGLLIPPPGEGKDPKSAPTAEEFLNAYGYSRGYMSQRGIPENARSSRYVLKDFVNGKLLYCYAPPGVPQEQYHTFVVPGRREASADDAAGATGKERKVVVTEADKRFFKAINSGVHEKGMRTPYGMTQESHCSSSSISSNPGEKPWKKHNNRNKREKLRRIYNNLDN